MKKSIFILFLNDETNSVQTPDKTQNSENWLGCKNEWHFNY